MSLNTAASLAQLKASDPAATVWVNANAGSGKTHVLVDRVVRLMLGGTEPSRIMCLTFTKAAAAESAFQLLNAWGGVAIGEHRGWREGGIGAVETSVDHGANEGRGIVGIGEL